MMHTAGSPFLSLSLRGAQRRGNLAGWIATPDFVVLAMTNREGKILVVSKLS
jgi:hypothetical protein